MAHSGETAPGGPPGGRGPGESRAPGTGGTGGQDDLDALIGDIRREAARRRAAPDFPIEEEARLGTEMDRQGPTAHGADVVAIVSALDGLARGDHPGPTNGPEPATGSDAPIHTGSGATGADPALRQVAALAASAVRAATVRISRLEGRMAELVAAIVTEPAPAEAVPLELPGQAELPGQPECPGQPDLLGYWAASVIDAAAGRASQAGVAEVGRPASPVLVAGPGAREWVQTLAGAGLDAYGVDPHLAEFADAGPVRAGTLAGHLPAVAPGGLSTTIVVGPQPAADLPALHAVVSGLATRTASVVVVSEAPWWWRRRLGAPAADLSAWRPISPETWLSLLAGAGYLARAVYGPLGRDYLVTAARVDAPAPDPATLDVAVPEPPGSAG